MVQISHVTSIECAKSILKSKAIFGCGSSKESHEAYPHFYHSEKPKSFNQTPCDPEIELFFDCDLPEKETQISPPVPDTLNVHIIDGNFWQCTIHPSTKKPINFVRWKVINDSNISEKERKFFSRSAKEEIKIQVVWQNEYFTKLKNRGGIFRRLLSHITK